MAIDYDQTVARTRAVLSEDHVAALGDAGRASLYDAVLAMTFADGVICDEEARFLSDFASIIGSQGSDEDLTPDALCATISALDLERGPSEAFAKVLLIVTDLDDDVAASEIELWRQFGTALDISNDRLMQIRKLLTQIKAPRN